MSAFSLTFRVDAPTTPADGTWSVTSEESQALRQRLYTALGVKPRSVAWVTILPGTRKGDAVLRVEYLFAGGKVYGLHSSPA